MELSLPLGYASDPRQAADVWRPTLFIPEKEAEAVVPEEFCELISLCGPNSYVRERVEAFREAGVDMLDITPVGPEPARLVETVKSWLQEGDRT